MGKKSDKIDRLVADDRIDKLIKMLPKNQRESAQNLYDLVAESDNKPVVKDHHYSSFSNSISVTEYIRLMFFPREDDPIAYWEIPYTCSGDYVGSFLESANRVYLLDQYGIESSSAGFYAEYCLLDQSDVTRILDDEMLYWLCYDIRGLENYPAFDDEIMSKLEYEAFEEYVNDNLSYDISHQLSQIDEIAKTVFDNLDSEEEKRLLWDAVDEVKPEYEPEMTSIYIPDHEVEKLAQFICARLQETPEYEEAEAEYEAAEAAYEASLYCGCLVCENGALPSRSNAAREQTIMSNYNVVWSGNIPFVLSGCLKRKPEDSTDVQAMKLSAAYSGEPYYFHTREDNSCPLIPESEFQPDNRTVYKVYVIGGIAYGHKLESNSGQ